MLDSYFENFEINGSFQKEYISLWSSWLGLEKLHLLDTVSKQEWSRFNSMILDVSKVYKLGVVDLNLELITFPSDIAIELSDYTASMNKDASQFSKYIIPDLECILTEEWDYTYILWHKNNGAVEALRPFILSANLKHFSDGT